MTIYVVVEIYAGIIHDVSAFTHEPDAIEHCAIINQELGYEVDENGLIADVDDAEQAESYANLYVVELD